MKYRQDMHINIDNLSYEGNTVTHNLSDIINYVIQYRFQGGPEQPIRYLEMKVNKNDIDKAYPDLMHSIVEGKTRLLIDAVDGGTFIITKIWLKDNEYDLVATGIEVTLNTATLTGTLANSIANLDPPLVIQTIFNDWKSTLNLTEDDDFRLYLSEGVSTTRTAPGYKIGFKENMPTLVAMNMCALLDDAFIFFSDKEWTDIVNGNPVTKRYNTMYYVRYDDIKPLAYNPGDPVQNGVVNVYPRMDSKYTNYTKFDLLMFKRLIGLSSKNSEGSETIVNNQIVSMEGGKGEALNSHSIRMYGDYAGTTVMSDLMISYDVTIQGTATSTAQIIAENLVRRYKDPTRSITIELSEIITEGSNSGWDGTIEPFSYAYRINDNVNNIILTNTHLCEPELISNQPNPDKSDNFMLRLSTFVRAYPEMTTEYTFGVMKETTLSQELANKLTGMSGTITDIRVNGTSIANNGIVTVDTTPSSDQTQNPAHLVTSNGVYNAIQSAISGVAPSGTIGDDIHPLKLVNGTLTPVTGVIADVKYNNQTVATSGIVTVDLTPTDNSHNPVSSDGVYDAIDDLKTLILGAIYPVGSIYMNMNDTMPTVISNLGTWERIGEGTALISAGTNYTAGTSYGANTKTITANNLPEHTHSLSNHSHSISFDGGGTVTFGPIVLEGTDTGVSGTVSTKSGIYDNDNTKWRTVSSGISSSDDSVSSSGSANKSRYMQIESNYHRHGGSTGDAGGGDTGNNTTNKDNFDVMQLSVAVYMWKRTA